MVPDRSAHRRLFRLILALGLVLIVMQRAGDPKVYRMFFPELQQTTAVQDDHLTLAASPFSDRTDSDDSTNQNYQQINDSVDDVALLDSVSDSALWTKADQSAFYRLLATGGAMKHLTQPAQQTGALSLLNQADVYLKTKVLVIGKLARVEQVAAKANDFEVKQYYQLWINPNDASEQPTPCYCARLMSSLEPYLGQSLIHDGPVVHMEGVYLKRIAYAAQAGSQLAPVIVGRITAGPALVSTLPTNSSHLTTASASLPLPWKWLVLLAVGSAALVSFAIFRFSAAYSQRTRIARQQSQRLDAEALIHIPVTADADSFPNPHEGR